jgi:hypothetical protein
VAMVLRALGDGSGASEVDALWRAAHRHIPAPDSTYALMYSDSLLQALASDVVSYLGTLGLRAVNAPSAGDSSFRRLRYVGRTGSRAAPQRLAAASVPASTGLQPDSILTLRCAKCPRSSDGSFDSRSPRSE